MRTTDGPGEDRDRLVMDSLDLVGAIVREISARFPAHVDRGELWGAGALGLVEAAGRFDPSTGVPFRRYAAIRIRGAILDQTRRSDWATRSVRSRARRVADAEASMPAGKERSDAHLARRTGLTAEQVRRARAGRLAASILSFDAGGGDDRAVPVGAAGPPDPGSALESAEMHDLLEEAVEGLPEALRTVVSAHDLGGRPLQELAVELGLSPARLSQLRNEALLALRAFFGEQYEEVPAVGAAEPGSRARTRYLAEMAERRRSSSG
jgi:RNA polymerase sigma factor for flagellar operon FliA